MGSMKNRAVIRPNKQYETRIGDRYRSFLSIVLKAGFKFTAKEELAGARML